MSRTVPTYVVAAASFLIFGRLSDHYGMRSPFIAIACLFAIIGYAILIAAPHPVARYVGLFFIAIGLYPSTALNLAWVGDISRVRHACANVSSAQRMQRVTSSEPPPQGACR